MKAAFFDFIKLIRNAMIRIDDQRIVAYMGNFS